MHDDQEEFVLVKILHLGVKMVDAVLAIQQGKMRLLFNINRIYIRSMLNDDLHITYKYSCVSMIMIATRTLRDQKLFFLAFFYSKNV